MGRRKRNNEKQNRCNSNRAVCYVKNRPDSEVNKICYSSKQKPVKKVSSCTSKNQCRCKTILVRNFFVEENSSNYDNNCNYCQEKREICQKTKTCACVCGVSEIENVWNNYKRSAYMNFFPHKILCNLIQKNNHNSNKKKNSGRKRNKWDRFFIHLMLQHKLLFNSFCSPCHPISQVKYATSTGNRGSFFPPPISIHFFFSLSLIYPPYSH